MNFHNLKPLFGIGMGLLFILLGFYLIEKEDQFARIIGYTNIIFWSCLILFTLYKFLTRKKV